MTGGILLAEPGHPVAFRAVRHSAFGGEAHGTNRPDASLAESCRLPSVNGQVAVPGGGRLKVPTPRVDQVLFRVVPFLALASRMR